MGRASELSSWGLGGGRRQVCGWLRVGIGFRSCVSEVEGWYDVGRRGRQWGGSGLVKGRLRVGLKVGVGLIKGRSKVGVK